MTLIRDLVNLCNEFLENPGQYRPMLSAIKGFRNGVVYGAKIRAPHALVMTFLFREGTIADKLRVVLHATLNHSRNLAFFAFIYKILQAFLRMIFKQQISSTRNHPFLTFIVGSITGYVVFNKKTPVSNQIMLYLLSRVVVGLVNLSIKYGVFKPPSGLNTFPLVSAVIWGIVMVLYEFEKDTLQDSLVASMIYLHDDSDSWHNLKDFIWHNK